MEESDRRGELGRFLRTCRERLTPDDIGLPSSKRRRTPGLRRGEVAELAGIGVDWYGYMEMGRDITVAPKTLLRVAAALSLGPQDTSRLFHLAIKQIPGAVLSTELATNAGTILEEVDRLIRCLCEARSFVALARCAAATAHKLAKPNVVAYFALMNAARSELEFVSCVGRNADLMPKVKPFASMAQELELLRSGRVTLESRPPLATPRPPHAGFRFLLSAPVFEHGTLTGVVGYADKASRIPGADDERVLRIIANAVTLALSNAPKFAGNDQTLAPVTTH